MVFCYNKSSKRPLTHSKMKSQEAEKLHQKFKEYGGNAQTWIRKCKILLPDIAEYKVWKKKGFGSIYEYSAKLAGMSRASVDDALWTMRKIQDKPALKQIAEEKGLGRVRAVATIATKETEEFWAEKAREMSKNTLLTYVKHYREESWSGPKNQPDKGIEHIEHVKQNMEQRTEISIKCKTELANKLAQFSKREDFEDLLEEFLEVIETREQEEKPEPVKNNSRYIPVKIKRHVIRKTSGKCTFPGCKKEHTSLHHTQRFGLEKIHDPDRLVPLCDAHEKLMHLGLIENEEGPPETWKVRKRPDQNHHKKYVDDMVWLHRN